MPPPRPRRRHNLVCVEEAVRRAVTRIADARPLAWERVVGGGYTRLPKWRVRLAGGSSLFVKEGPVEDAELRLESAVYEGVRGSFLPRFVGATEEERRRVLVLEDLSEAVWPPPYPAATWQLFEAIDAAAATAPPTAAPVLPERDPSRL